MSLSPLDESEDLRDGHGTRNLFIKDGSGFTRFRNTVLLQSQFTLKKKSHKSKIIILTLNPTGSRCDNLVSGWAEAFFISKLGEIAKQNNSLSKIGRNNLKALMYN